MRQLSWTTHRRARELPSSTKKVRGLYHRLSREQRSVVRQMGSQLFQQHQAVQQRQQSQATPNEQQRAPVAVMELPQNHVNPLACILPVLPTTSPMRPRTLRLGPETASRRPLPTSPKRRLNGITIVNVYRRPSYDAALDILLRWSPPEICLVAGDFNAKHYSWQTGRLAGRGDDIAAWAAESGLGLLNTADVPTNPHGNTIDLAFSNIDLASASHNPKCHPGAYRNARQGASNQRRGAATLQGLVEAGVCSLPAAATTASELDALAESLVNLLHSAAKAAGRPVRKGTRSAPWWTDECAESAAEYRAVRRIFPMGFNEEVQAARKAFQNVLLGQCSGVQSSSLAQVTQPPPLQIDGVVYETQMDKANALRRSTLERRTAADDIDDPWIPVCPPRQIPFAAGITLAEAEDATTKTGNTSPGADNITIKTLRTVWGIIGEHVRRLYEGCLVVGHHPQAFCEAEVVMITKAGKGDLIHYEVLHPQQAGALPKRWAVDLVAALVHDIEEAFAHKQVVTLVTADIQGAFDSALYNRLVLRLRERVGQTMWHALYTEPIYRLGKPEGRFGYADDTAILCIGESLQETARKATECLEGLVAWGAANGITFDPDKTEVKHFSLKSHRNTPAVRHGGTEKYPEKAMHGWASG
ncbi:Endonuclease/exonuclease/phosphatase, partial [Metarhizium majus ARSEF 297]